VVGKKVYLQPKGMVINGICDLVEVQKGRITFSDTPGGVVHFLVKMYGAAWELKFTVTDLGQNRTCVRLEVESEKGQEKFIHREFALLDSFLITGAEIEAAEKAAQQPEEKC